MAIAPVFGARILEGENRRGNDGPMLCREQPALEEELPLGLREPYSVRKLRMLIEPIIDALAVNADFGSRGSEGKTTLHEVENFFAKRRIEIRRPSAGMFTLGAIGDGSNLFGGRRFGAARHSIDPRQIQLRTRNNH